MFQSGSNISVQDNLTEILHDDWNAFPKLSSKPYSKDLFPLKKELMKKQDLNLPQLRAKNSIKQVPKTDRYTSNLKKQSIDKIFRLEASKKRKGYGNHSEETRQENKTEESDDYEFEMRIKENREKIREEKSKKEKKKIKEMKKVVSKEKLDRNNEKFRLDRKTEKKKVVEKRKSTENSLGKKSIKEPFRNLPSKNKQPKHCHQNKIKYKCKSKNLFQNLQEFLQNPNKQKKKQEKLLVGLSLLKAKRNLEDKLKIINRKLGQKGSKRQKQDRKQNSQKTNPSDWRKFSLRDNLYSSSITSFEIEVDKIGELQERIENNLEDFIEYQQLMLELEYRKKLKKGRKNFQ